MSIVFSDIKGSTDLGESVDSEALREVLGRYFDEMQAVVERHGGRVEKYIGDAIMAVFGLPTVHEDDAIRAVRAAAEMKTALARLNDELEERWGVRLENRTGVNTGEVVAGDPALGQRLVTGDAVNVAARLEQAAPALEVLIGEPTYKIVREVVEVEAVEQLELKGKAERVPAYRLISVQGVEEVDRRRDSPLVGRARELQALASELRLARAEGATRIVTLVGQAGVGKSRLVDELSRRAAEARVLRGRCLPYGSGITFWPVVEIVKQAAGIVDSDAPDVAYAKIAALPGASEDVAQRVASAVGLADGQFAVEELFWAIRRLLAGLAADRDLVVVFEDIHWAETKLLDLIEHLGESGGLEALVLCTSRPEIAEMRAGWASGSRHSLLELKPLSDEESRVIIANLLGSAGLESDVETRITAAAQGNPLYVEQLLSMLIDDGVLREQDERWESAQPVGDVTIPPTIHALLSARLDLLTTEERAVVDAASVIGLEFSQPAVEALVTDTVRPDVSTHLASLCRRQLVRSEPSAPEAAFRFDHMLIKDAAYGALLKRRRALYHEQFADWAERINSERERETEYEEILGHHLEQAHTCLADLGPLDEHGRQLGYRAADKLASAGQRAFQREDMPAAANLLRRAIDLWPAEDEQRLALLPTLGETLTGMGEFSQAKKFLDEAATTAATRGDERLSAEVAFTLLFLERHTGPADDFAQTVLEQANRSLPVFEQARDYAGLAKAWRLIMNVRGTAYRFSDAAEAAERARFNARLAGDRRGEASAVAGLAMASFHGPTPVSDAIEYCNDILGQRLGDRSLEALLLRLLAPLHAMLGHFDEARALYGRARTTLEEMGATLRAATVSLDSATVEMLADDFKSAERELRRDYEVLERLGETYIRPTVAAYLGRVLCEQGRFDEADTFVSIAAEITSEDDVVSQALWRSVRASILAHRGRLTEAVQHATAAVKLLRATDGVLKQADVLVVLSKVQLAAGRLEEAKRAALEALALYDTKGNVVAAARVQEAIADIDGQLAGAASEYADHDG